MSRPSTLWKREAIAESCCLALFARQELVGVWAAISDSYSQLQLCMLRSISMIAPEVGPLAWGSEQWNSQNLPKDPFFSRKGVISL